MIRLRRGVVAFATTHVVATIAAHVAKVQGVPMVADPLVGFGVGTVAAVAGAVAYYWDEL